MPRRTICIQNPAEITVKNASLIVINDKGRAAIPLEDIWVVIVESHLVQVSSAALAGMSDAGIGLMTCGKDHMPNGLLLPLGAHSRHAQIVENQLAMSKPLQKRIWQQLVISKIRNQARALELLGLDGSPVHAISNEVASGDTTNREAVAASAYFKRLLPNETRRDSKYTASLDYGYSVLRAGIGRAAVAGGWLVSRGLHHSNNLNAFNLVDDLIEPFRPLVDLLVISRRLSGALNPMYKGMLASMFEYKILMGNRRLGLQAAIEMQLDTLKEAVINNDSTRLVLPKLIELERLGCE